MPEARPEDEWDKIFAYEHLQPHLRFVSAPFCEIAKLILNNETLSENAFLQLSQFVRANLPQNRQAARACHKISLIENAYAHPSRREAITQEHVLDLLVEAKDCAVRAVVVNTPAKP